MPFLARLISKDSSVISANLQTYDGDAPPVGTLLEAKRDDKTITLKVVAVHPGDRGATGEPIDTVDVVEVLARPSARSAFALHGRGHRLVRTYRPALLTIPS
jgi:hypothetical protein